jgi:drug/metabolite transporter (DMT)-like permease
LTTVNHQRLRHLSGIMYVNLATLAWGTNAILGRMLKDSAGPFSISAIRFTVAAVVFGVLLQFLPPEERRLGKDRWWVAAMALTGIVIFSPSLYLGLRYTTAVNSTLIHGLMPLITGLFALWMMKEPMSLRQIISSLAAFLGVAFLISGGSWLFWETADFNIGDIIILFSAVIWGLYSVIGSRVMKHRSSISATAFSIFMSLPVLWTLAIWEMQYIPLKLEPRVLLGILYIGIVPSGIGFYAWNAGVVRLGPGEAGVFYNTLPLFGALMGVFLLGEPIGIPHLIGGAMIVGGGVLMAYKPMKK